MAKPEAILSAQIAQFVRHFLPDDVFANLHPAGNAHPLTGQRLKWMGLIPGDCDWEVIYRGQVHKVEIKSLTGRTSKDQRHVQDRLVAAGAKVATDVRTLDAFVHQLEAWGIPILENPRRDPLDDGKDLPW